MDKEGRKKLKFIKFMTYDIDDGATCQLQMNYSF